MEDTPRREKRKQEEFDSDTFENTGYRDKRLPSNEEDQYHKHRRPNKKPRREEKKKRPKRRRELEFHSMEQQEANGTNSQNHVEHTPLLNNHQTSYPNLRQLQEQFAQTSLGPPPPIPLSPGLSPIAKEERVTSPPSAFPPKTMLDEIKSEDEKKTFNVWLKQYVTQHRMRRRSTGSAPESPLLSPSPQHVNTSAPMTSLRDNSVSLRDESIYSPVSEERRTLRASFDSDYELAQQRVREKLEEDRLEISRELSTRLDTSQEYPLVDLTSPQPKISNVENIHSLWRDPNWEWRKKKLQEEEKRMREEIEEKKNKLRQLAEATEREIQEQLKKASKKDEYPPLSPEELKRVEEALNGGRPADVLSKGFNINITREDMHRLRDGEWLNDEVVNFYMNVLHEHSKKNGSPKCHVFNTFFYSTLRSGGYRRVAKWTRQVDIFTMDKVVVPIHLGNHWCLAVINFKEKKFQYYDSLGGSNEECLQILKEYVREEFKDKKKGDYDFSGWEMETPSNIPHQKNGYDCGVFMCRYAACVFQNKNFTFDQKHMNYFRKRIVLDILNKNYSV